MNKIELARNAIDEAITVWQLANGVSKEQIDKLDYSFIDEELNSLI